MDPAAWELLEGYADEEVEAIIRLSPSGAAPETARLVARFGDIATCRLRRGDILETHAEVAVSAFKAPRLLGPERPPALEPADGPGDPGSGDVRRPPELAATGQGVVVGVVDWGCDFAHPDFRNADGSTRLLALWDQRGPAGPLTPQPYGYGRHLRREAIDAALRAADPYAALGYHPVDGDPDEGGSHGAHVTSIAASNGRGGGPVGMAPEAQLIFVHLASRQTEGIANLGDSVTLLEAVDFITHVAGDRPCVINLSVGRHGGPHDGSTLVEQGFDQLLSAGPGRCIVQSAGNYFDQDIHTAGRLRPGEIHTLRWVVSEADLTPNELEIWYPGRDTFALEVTPPGAATIRLGLGSQAPLMVSGREVGRAYHRARDSNNGNHHINLFMDPGAPAGTWEIRLLGEDVLDGRYHGWVERDGGCRACQSHFAPDDSDPGYTTGTICNGMRTIAVGAYNAHSPRRELARFSSAGPTLDGRQKPDCLAPGVRILAARSAPRSSRGQAPLYTRKSGTSMAAPYVAGTVACMYQAAGRPLTIQEVRAALLGSTVPAPADLPRARVGSGYVDPARAVEAARRIGRARPVRAAGKASVRAPAAAAGASLAEDAQRSPLGQSPAEAVPARARLVEREADLAMNTITKPRGMGRYTAGAGEAEAWGANVLEQMLIEAGRIGPGSADPGAYFLAPAAVFDALAGGGRPGPRRYYAQWFDVVAGPGQALEQALRPGDLLLRRSLGEGRLAHLSVLATGQTLEAEDLAEAGLQPEAGGAGLFAQVLHGGQPGRLARRLAAADGRLGPHQMLLRLRAPAAAETRWLEACGEQAAEVLPPPVVAAGGHTCQPGEGPPAAEPDPSGKGPHPLVKRGTSSSHSRRPSVGFAQQCLNNFLAQLAAGTHTCAAQSASAQQFIQANLAQLQQAGQLPLVVDCRFGPATERATRIFQACAGIERDGKIGPITWPLLEAFATPPPPVVTTCFAPPVSADDPTGPAVAQAGADDFDAGTATIHGASLRVRGRVFYPAQNAGNRTPFSTSVAQAGPAPIVFIAHGNHGVFSNPANRTDERCSNPGGFVPIANHRGYEYFQEALAQLGVISVSIDCNQTNCSGLSALNIRRRAGLIEQAIRHFQARHGNSADPIFGGRIDFSRVGLVGHSRGAEAVLVVPEDLALPATGITGVTVRAVISIAPTDTGASSGRPAGFAFATVLPAGDGDVVENDGAKFYDQAGADPFKCQLYVHHANHNFFNREWVEDESLGPPVMTRTEHEQILTAYGCALFRSVLLGHNLVKFLRGDELPPNVTAANVHLSFEQPGAVTVDDHENRNIALNALGQATSQAAGLTAAEFDFAQAATGTFNGTFFGKTVGMVAQSSTSAGQFRSLLAGPTDLTGREIWIRMAEVYDGAAVPAGATGGKLGLEDAAGTVAFVDTDLVGGLPRPYDRRVDDLAGVGVDLTKTMLKTLRYPAGCFTQAAPAFDLTRVRAILLQVDRGDGRALAYDQLQIV